jgi:hypothetical protein
MAHRRSLNLGHPFPKLDVSGAGVSLGIAVLQQQMGDLPTGVLTTDQFFRLSQASDNIERRLILDSQDEIGALVGYLTTNEANSEKLVYLSLSGDHFGRPEMLNVINVDLSGFSKGIAALDTACAAPR